MEILVCLTAAMPAVTLRGLPAMAVFSGFAPGYAGLDQVDAQVPTNAPAGDAVRLRISIGNAVSDIVTIAVAGPTGSQD
jgi:uncharacterized protein (TIGR03437 family)